MWPVDRGVSGMMSKASVGRAAVTDVVGSSIGSMRAGDVAEPAAAGDFGELYRREFPALVRIALLMGVDSGSAEDVVQDAFVRFQARPQPLDDPARAGGYLRVSVVNGARSQHRRRMLARRRLASAFVRHADAADAAVLLNEEHRLVAVAVRALAPRQQHVIVLRYWAGMSEAEIARTLGISAGTVKSTAARALAKLARRLGEDTE